MARRCAWLLSLAAAALLADSGAGLHWIAPANWKSEAQRPMRLATYLTPPAAGDRDSGECGVFYFGQGEGGSVDANIDRWIGQFLQPDGKPARQAAKVEKRTIHGLRATTVDVSGSYTGMGGPGAPHSGPRPGYRLLGAVVEAPQGTVFFKFTGPVKTIAQNHSAFEKMLSTLSTQ